MAAYEWRYGSGVVSRRRALQAGAAAGSALAAMYLAACGGSGQRGSTASQTGPAPTVSANAPVATGVDPEKLVPEGIKKHYPLIDKYHWSRQTFSKNQPKSGGVFKTHGIQANPNWDPTDPGISNYASNFQLFFNRLVRADMSYERAFRNDKNFFKWLLTSDLAEKYEQPDQLSYTFKLIPGVKFHNVEPANGHELTAEDVKFSFDAYRAPTAAGQTAIFRAVEKFEAQDKYTFKITMKQPASYFLNALAGPITMVFSRQAYEKQGGLKNAPPTGTGPFIMDKYEFRNILTARRNPDYFVKGKPYLDGVENRWIPDRAALMAAYRSGQIDVFTGTFGWDEAEQILKTEAGKTDLNLFQHNVGGQPYFGVFLNKPPFNDVRVRRALSMALDRNALVKARYKEGRWSMGLPTDWSGQDYPHTPEQYGPNWQYNPAEAKKLLTAAGVDGLSWTLNFTAATGILDDQVPLAMEYWKAVGLKPEVKIVDQVAFQKAFFGREMEGMTFGAGLTGGTDLDDFAFRLMKSGEANNLYGISDPQLDGLLDAQQKEFDRGKKEQIGAQIFAREFDQVFRIWAASYLLADFKRPYVQGGYISHDVYFWANAWGLYQLADTWIDK